MRRLISIPIVHTPADLGSQREATRQAYIARYGCQQWRQHLETLAQLWHRIRQRVLVLPVDFTTVRLYQDGLPRCGRELAIVETLAAAGSSNHQLLLELVKRGAILMGTEDPTLLLQERDRLRQQHSAQPTPVAGEHPLYDTLIAQRDASIASRIASTLAEGELGLLFIGALHRVAQRLPEDITVYGLLDAREPSTQVEHRP